MNALQKKPQLIIIRGAPAVGKSILARGLANRLGKIRKVALLILDEFKWVMTAQSDRDRNDFKIAFENYLFALRNYLQAGYTVIAEDTWIRVGTDQETDIRKVIKTGKKYNASIRRILLKAPWNSIVSRNARRPMVVPIQQLKKQFQQVYALVDKDEVVINKEKDSQSVLRRALRYLH